jgi:hypothetical protein
VPKQALWCRPKEEKTMQKLELAICLILELKNKKMMQEEEGIF